MSQPDPDAGMTQSNEGKPEEQKSAKGDIKKGGPSATSDFQFRSYIDQPNPYLGPQGTPLGSSVYQYPPRRPDVLGELLGTNAIEPIRSFGTASQYIVVGGDLQAPAAPPRPKKPDSPGNKPEGTAPAKQSEGNSQFTAPIVMPLPDDMKVRLVTANALDALDEYRSNESKWFSWTGVFLGAVGGLAVNWATGATISIEGWILFGVLLAVSVLTGWSAFQFKRKGDQAKAKMFGQVGQLQDGTLPKV